MVGPASRRSSEHKTGETPVPPNLFLDATLATERGSVVAGFPQFADLRAGFVGLGLVLTRLDHGIMSALVVHDLRGLVLRAVPGLTLLQPGGNLLEILVACVAAIIVAYLLVSLRFFNFRRAVRTGDLVP